MKEKLIWVADMNEDEAFQVFLNSPEAVDSHSELSRSATQI
jgi:hypothetical protein